MTRSFDTGMPNTECAMVSRTRCGFCVLVLRTKLPSAGLKLPIAPRGSMGDAVTRLLVSLSHTRWVAVANAFSVRAASPVRSVKEILLDAAFHTRGAPIVVAFARMVTAGSG